MIEEDDKIEGGGRHLEGDKDALSATARDFRTILRFQGELPHPDIPLAPMYNDIILLRAGRGKMGGGGATSGTHIHGHNRCILARLVAWRMLETMRGSE